MFLESKDGGSGTGSAGSEDPGISRREHLCRWQPAVDRNNREEITFFRCLLFSGVKWKLNDQTYLVRILSLNMF